MQSPFKHSVIPECILTEIIVLSVEAIHSQQRDLREPTKDNIRSRIASLLKSTEDKKINNKVITNIGSTICFSWTDIRFTSLGGPQIRGYLDDVTILLIQRQNQNTKPCDSNGHKKQLNESA